MTGRLRSRRPFVWGCWFALALLGCGGDPIGRQGVSGAVTFDQRPIENGTIEFIPLDPKGIGGGAVVAQGRYEVPRPKGLPVGKYRVVLSATRSAPAPADEAPASDIGRPAKELLPENYNSRSTLQIEILPDGPRTFDFDLTSAAKP